MNQSAKRAYGGVATAMAMGGIAVPDSKLYAVSANLGAYRGETALAGGVASAGSGARAARIAGL